MDKRDFLKASGFLFTGGLLAQFEPMNSAAAQQPPRTNWSGNIEFHASEFQTPETLAGLRETVRKHASVKALGSRHSFNDIAGTSGDQISLEHFHGIELHEAERTVTVGAGVTYGVLAPYIDSRGYALHNLASLPQITVAGACATATHGSGNTNGNLSTAATAFDLVTADGGLLHVSREQHGDRFLGAVVSLGGLGIVTQTTLQVEPTYQVAQVVYRDLSFSQLEHHLEEIFGAGYSVSLFTDWQRHRATQVWIKRRLAPLVPADFPQTFFGAARATRKLHPIESHSAESCTEQLGIPGPWYDRLPHFRMNFTPSSGAEIQTEYLLPREHGYQAILAVEQLRERITPLLFVSELRTIAPDRLWMSMAYEQPSIAIHFTWKPDWPGIRNVLPLIEAKLAPFSARPHWAKEFTVPPSRLTELYPKMPDFRALLTEMDSKGKFRNAFLNRNIYRA